MLFNSDRPEMQKNQVKLNAGGNSNTSANIHHFRKTKWCFKHQRPHILHRTNSSQKKFNRNHVCVAIYSSLCASNWSLNICNSRLALNQIVLSWSSFLVRMWWRYDFIYQCLLLMCIILYYIFMDAWKMVMYSVMDDSSKIIMPHFFRRRYMR